jgi:predicted PurR-regulated permease PerM
MTLSSESFSRFPDSRGLIRFLLLFACGWAAVIAIGFFYNVLAMFISAAILAVLMDFPVRRLAVWMPRWLAITLVSFALLGVFVGFMTVLGFQVVNQGSSLFADLVTNLGKTNLPIKSYLQNLNFEQMLNVLRSSVTTGFGLVGGALSNVFTAIFLPVITLYMLADGGKLWAAVLRLLPEDLRERFDRSVQKNVLGFLRGQITLVIFLTISSFLAFTLLGVKFSLVLALIVGVLDAIPGIGATLGVAVVTFLVFISQGPWPAAWVLVASIVLQQIQDNIVHPRVMGRALEINPVVLFFALFIGERIAGLLGVFLAIPVAGMIVSWERDGAPAGTAVADVPPS